MRVIWIGGWGVPPESLRPMAEKSLPDAHHTFLPPVPGAAQSAADCDCLVAWSLGAWRVLEAAAGGLPFRGRVLLLAPFVAFCSDYHLGGRCSQAQVRWLRRWTQRDPILALRDFYQRAGLGEAPQQLPYAAGDLLEGLERLAEDASPALRAFAAKGLPENWRAVVGEADPLLDAVAISRALPGCTLAPDAGHKAEALISLGMEVAPT